MESFAKIELQGVVGKVTKQDFVKGKTFVLFSVMVSKSYKRKDEVVIDTQWFNCQAIDVDVKNGDIVHIKGDVTMLNYTDAEGGMHHSWQVLVNELTHGEV